MRILYIKKSGRSTRGWIGPGLVVSLRATGSVQVLASPSAVMNGVAGGSATEGGDGRCAANRGISVFDLYQCAVWFHRRVLFVGSHLCNGDFAVTHKNYTPDKYFCK